ncbi:hypothetical protein Tco_1176082 [Tanacetum coccineum]
MPDVTLRVVLTTCDDLRLIYGLCQHGGGVFRIPKTHIDGSLEIPKDPFNCLKVHFSGPRLISSTHAYNKYKVRTTGYEIKDVRFNLQLGKLLQGLSCKIIEDGYRRFKWFKRRCHYHNHVLFLEAMDRQAIEGGLHNVLTEIVSKYQRMICRPHFEKTDEDGEFGKLDPQCWLGSDWLAQAIADIPVLGLFQKPLFPVSDPVGVILFLQVFSKSEKKLSKVYKMFDFHLTFGWKQSGGQRRCGVFWRLDIHSPHCELGIGLVAHFISSSKAWSVHQLGTIMLFIQDYPILLSLHQQQLVFKVLRSYWSLGLSACSSICETYPVAVDL